MTNDDRRQVLRAGHMSGSVALLGAGGFIGTNLRKSLLADGMRVRAISRSWLTPPEPGLDLAITGETGQPGQVSTLVAGCDCVVVLSHGLLPGSDLGRAGCGMLDSLATILHLVDECERRGARLVYLSSGGTVYGPDAPVPTPEQTVCDPISMYGVSKLATEKILSVHARQRGLNYAVLRVSNPYGPWQLGKNGQGVIGAWLTRAIAGREIEVWGDGSVVRDYVYIDDLVDAIRATIAYRGGEHVFNIGSGRGESLREVLGVIGDLCPVAVRYAQPRAVDVPVSVLDVERAGRELGWRPATPLADGVRLTLEWMKEHCAREES